MDDLVEQVYNDIINFEQQYPHGIVVFWGATATGKSRLSVEIARKRAKNNLQTGIISADSRQLFRYMDIGTDKVSAQIRNEIPHYQIDIVDPTDFYTAGQRKKDTINIVHKLQEQESLPLIVGGTGLYIDTLYKNYSVPEVGADFTFREKCMQEEEKIPGILWERLHKIDPVEAEKHHPHSTRYIIRALEIYEKTGLTKTDSAKEQPVDFPMLMIGLWRDTADSNTRITKRVGEMVEKDGLVDEVLSLLKKGYTPDLQAMQGIGYQETIAYLQSHNQIPSNISPTETEVQPMSLEQLKELISLHTQQYAKRQRTRFRRYIADAENKPKQNVMYKVYTLE